MVNVVKAVIEKEDNIPGWVDTLSRDMETIQMKILEKNNSVAEMKNSFSWLNINLTIRLNTVK